MVILNILLFVVILILLALLELVKHLSTCPGDLGKALYKRSKVDGVFLISLALDGFMSFIVDFRLHITVVLQRIIIHVPKGLLRFVKDGSHVLRTQLSAYDPEESRDDSILVLAVVIQELALLLPLLTRLLSREYIPQLSYYILRLIVLVGLFKIGFVIVDGLYGILVFLVIFRAMLVIAQLLS